MAVACPGCSSAAQVHHLPAFWRSLSQDAELKAELAPPPAAALQWMPAAGCLALAVILMVAGAPVFGVVALVVAGLVGWTAYRSFGLAQAAVDAWAAALYCRHCHRRFPPGSGLVEAA